MVSQYQEDKVLWKQASSPILRLILIIKWPYVCIDFHRLQIIYTYLFHSMSTPKCHIPILPLFNKYRQYNCDTDTTNNLPKVTHLVNC